MNQFSDQLTIYVPLFQPLEDCSPVPLTDIAIAAWHVPSDGNRALREPVEQLASNFRREMNLDFVPYCSEETSSTDSAFLFGYTPDINVHLAIGAVFFCWKEWPTDPACYSLEWVWIHPFFRNRGLLEQLWPHLEKRFAPFHISGPRSTAMKGFLKRVGYIEVI